MNNVVGLDGKPIQPVEREKTNRDYAITSLEQYLEYVKKTPTCDFKYGLVIMGLNTSGSAVQTSNTNDVDKLIGALTILKVQLIQSMKPKSPSDA